MISALPSDSCAAAAARATGAVARSTPGRRPKTIARGHALHITISTERPTAARNRDVAAAGVGGASTGRLDQHGPATTCRAVQLPAMSHSASLDKRSNCAAKAPPPPPWCEAAERLPRQNQPEPRSHSCWRSETDETHLKQRRPCLRRGEPPECAKDKACRSGCQVWLLGTLIGSEGSRAGAGAGLTNSPTGSSTVVDCSDGGAGGSLAPQKEMQIPYNTPNKNKIDPTATRMGEKQMMANNSLIAISRTTHFSKKRREPSKLAAFSLS